MRYALLLSPSDDDRQEKQEKSSGICVGEEQEKSNLEMRSENKLNLL
jgi:hypothetical protein